MIAFTCAGCDASLALPVSQVALPDHADPSITLHVHAHVIRAAEASAADVFAEAIGE